MNNKFLKDSNYIDKIGNHSVNHLPFLAGELVFAKSEERVIPKVIQDMKIPRRERRNRKGDWCFSTKISNLWMFTRNSPKTFFPQLITHHCNSLNKWNIAYCIVLYQVFFCFCLFYKIVSYTSYKMRFLIINSFRLSTFPEKNPKNKNMIAFAHYIH